MADESSKAASQAFSVIPNAYFDLIGRVVPGCLFLFAISRVSAKNSIIAITDVFIPYAELRGSTTAWIFVVLAAGYVLGHAFSPLVRFLEEGPGWVESLREQRQKSGRKFLDYFLPPFWTRPEALKSECKKLQARYNKLRFVNPAAATLAIRIRAEYTMYGGFATAFGVTLLLVLIYLFEALAGGRLGSWIKGVTTENWLLLAAAILGFPMMLYRHLHTWNRFRNTVDQLLEAGKENKDLVKTQSATL